VLAVVVAFLMGSFAARNPDLWRHLAAGKLVTQFQYPIGGDPFTYTAAERPWVNAHWLGEVVLYTLYSVDTSGAIAVGVKAIAFAAAVGLLFLLRKPGAPLWPWAAVAVVGAVAAGAFTHLRPQVFGLPLLAGILVVLYTADWMKGSKWRVPGILGGLTAVWANVDNFAFLSPLLIGLIVLGEWLHPKLFPAKSDLPSKDDPFRPSPPQPALLRALFLCGVAVLANPTFFGAVVRNPLEAVAQLVPFELDWPAAADLGNDNDLYRFTFSVLHQSEPDRGEPGYLSNPILGNNWCGWMAVALWAAGTIAAGVGYRHGRLSHLLAWAVFSLLGAVVHARFVPYGVLLGVPFLAAHLNGLGRLMPPLDRLRAEVSRAVLLACRAGRVLTLLGMVVLAVAAVYGWLQPWDGTAAGRRYAGWNVAPDEGMKRAAEVFARWRADDQRSTVKMLTYPIGGGAITETEIEASRAEVLSSTRGLNTHPDLGDYLAFFAPAEKSFVTSRYRLHRTELKDLAEVRKQVLARWSAPGGQSAAEPFKLPVEVGWLEPIADRYGVGYVSVAQTNAQIVEEAFLNTRLGFGVLPEDEQRLFAAPWHLDGRLLVVGRTFSLTRPERNAIEERRMSPELAAKAERLRGYGRNNRVMTWDVAKEVFAPASQLPAPPPPLAAGQPPEQGWEYELLFLRPPLRPVGLDDSRNLSWYSNRLLEMRRQRDQLRQFAWQQGLAGVTGAPGLLLTLPVAGPQPYGPLPQPVPPAEQEFALPFLIARSARGGLTASPNSASGYISLATAFEKPLMPNTDPPADVFGGSPYAPTESQLQVLTALRRATTRLPEPEKTSDEYLADALSTRLWLAQMYLQLGPPLPVGVGFRRGPQGTELITQPGPRLGYVDSAAAEVAALFKVLAVNGRRAGEAAGGLIELWRRVVDLCVADFWLEFPEIVKTGQVPQDWWEKLSQNNLGPLLVQRGYLEKDDLGDWMERMASGKADSGEVLVRMKRLVDVLDNLVIRRKGASRMPPAEYPAERFDALVRTGLIETALKMLEVKEGQEPPPVRATNGERLRLVLWVGRAEDAVAYLPKLRAKVETSNLPAEVRALEAIQLRALDFDLARLRGDYAEADAVYAELLDTQPPAGLQPDPRSLTLVVFPELWRPLLLKPLTDAEVRLLVASGDLFLNAAAVGGYPGMLLAENMANTLRLRLLYRALTHYQRGVYAMLGGDPARAKEHFDRAADPHGVSRFLPPLPPEASKELREGLPVRRFALSQLGTAFNTFLPKYLELLKKYAAH
jgi:hypothetical protein